jgi:hypothetical protein
MVSFAVGIFTAVAVEGELTEGDFALVTTSFLVSGLTLGLGGSCATFFF